MNLRTMDSICFPEGCKLEQHLNDFKTQEGWYKRKGLPYKLVVLLHGPPGTGKSVTASAICNALGRSRPPGLEHAEGRLGAVPVPVPTGHQTDGDCH